MRYVLGLMGMLGWYLGAAVGSFLVAAPVPGWQVWSGVTFGVGVWLVATVGERWMKRRVPAPIPPENVRIVLPQQCRVIPVECVYTGRDGDGFHGWKAVFPVHVGMDLDGMHILVGMMPPRTSVGVELVGRRR